MLQVNEPISGWTHLAVVYQNNTAQLYVNGAAKGNPVASPGGRLVHPSSQLGGVPYASGWSRFKGALDEVRVWSMARTSVDIARDYQKVLSGRETGLAAYWRFEAVTSNQTGVTGRAQPIATLAGGWAQVAGNNTDPASLTTVFSWTSEPTGFTATGVPVVATPNQTTTYTVSRSDATCRALVRVQVSPEPCTLDITASRTTVLPGEGSVLTLTNGTASGGKGLWLDGGGSTSIQPQSNYSTLHSNFTWEAWVWPEWGLTGDNGAERYVLFPEYAGGTGQLTHAGMGIAVGTNGIRIIEHTGDYLPEVTRYNASLSGWTHLAVVYQNNAASLFVNGVKVKGPVASPGGKLVHPSAIMGGDVYGRYRGKLDEVRVWNRARTESEITADYRRILTGLEQGLVTYWRFETIGGGQTEAQTPAGLKANLYGYIQAIDGFTAPKPLTGQQTFAWAGSDGSAGSGAQLTVSPQRTTTYTVRCTDCAASCNTPTITVNSAVDPVACYRLTARHSNKLVSVVPPAADGSLLQQLPARGLDTQVWKLEPLGAGVATLRPATESRVAESEANNVRLWSPRTTFNQGWTLQRAGDGYYQLLVENNPGLALGVRDYAGDDGAKFEVLPNGGGPNQQFALETVGCPYVAPDACSATGYATYERWTGITGTAVSDLRNSPKFGQAADFGELVTSLEARTKSAIAGQAPDVAAQMPEADNYGARLSAYVCAPANGEYSFWVEGDDNVELWLSTDDAPANKRLIASHNAYTLPRQYENFPSQRSPLITLQKGKKYYLEALQKEGTGGDNLSVSWQIPGSSWDRLPISGQYLSPVSTCAFSVSATPAVTDLTKIELVLGETVGLTATRPAGMVSTDAFVWEHKQWRHIVSGTDSVRTKEADAIQLKPTSVGQFTYRVALKSRPTCFKEITVIVKDVLCVCQDCDKAEVKSTDNPLATHSASPEKNYVMQTVYLDESKATAAQTITYFDGIGRPLQKVAVRAGGTALGQVTSASDLVTHYEYDAMGREPQQFLPLPRASTGGAYSLVKAADITSYHNGLQKTGNAFTQIQFENSPLSRVTGQTAPGSSIATSVVYRTNTTGEVPMLTYDFATAKVTSTTYAAGELYVTETTDEKSQITIECKDKQGQIVARIASGRKTLYCYDDFGLLRCVVPPKVSTALENNMSFDPFTGDLLFAYQYDARQRVTGKKVPGSGTLRMTYYDNDLLKTQTDAKGIVITYEYDNLNRLVRTSKAGEILTENYYDGYGPEAKAFAKSHAFDKEKSTNVKGLLTSSKVMADDKLLTTTTYYDELNRPIQIVADNHKGGIDRSSSRLDFTGRILESKLTTLNDLEVLTRTSYEQGGRVKAICQQLSGPDVQQPYWEPVARHSYNDLGELTTKVLGCNLQKVDYVYTMRGWLKSMNDPETMASNGKQERDFYGMKLDHDAIGNITTWTMQSAIRKGTYASPFETQAQGLFTYGFTYDNLNRLKTGKLSKVDTGTEVFALGGSDQGSIGYDDNGNILSLSRTLNSTMVDNLTYSYGASSNRLSAVTDAAQKGRTDEFFNADAGYTYDANGNLTGDSGKGITGISYNHLNLPEQIKKGSQVIKYLYSATGQKLKADFGGSKIYDYVAGLVYDQSGLEFIPTAEGRI